MESATDIIREDGLKIADCVSVDWSILEGCSVFVTGATGLIGVNLIRGIMAYNESHNGNIKVLALVRNTVKAQNLFSKYLDKKCLKLVEGDILTPFELEEPVDYIIHGASVTASRDFVEKPVETITTAIDGTRNILELARAKQVKSMVYMSSMEVYGTPYNDEPLTEDKMGYLDPLAVRSSYSESKQMVENLCVAYHSEYQVPVKILRLTQTFGPGVAKDDKRVFAEFARCAMQDEEIRLQTEGLTKRMYLYTADAATALLTVLTKGQNGQAYNAANKNTYCSIREMAEMVAKEFGHGTSKVVIAIPEVPNASFNPVMCVYLETTKLRSLGWNAMVDLKEMYRRMLVCME